MELADMVEELDERGDDLKLTEWERSFVGDMLDRLTKVDHDDEAFNNRLSNTEAQKIKQIHDERT